MTDDYAVITTRTKAVAEVRVHTSKDGLQLSYQDWDADGDYHQFPLSADQARQLAHELIRLADRYDGGDT